MLSSTTVSEPTAHRGPERDQSDRTVSGIVRTLLELSKARLCGLVLLTMLAGYWLALPGAEAPGSLFPAILGTLMSALGANALNQCIEVELDRRMKRTRLRPLPGGRLDAEFAWVFALAMAIGGAMILGVAVNFLTGALSAACTLLYVLVYTPMKQRGPSNTLVGAICGAIPPVMGWTAAAGRIEWGALALAAVLFIWQLPHFLALAWMYRDDYRDGGFQMLPAHDPDGGITGRTSLLFALLLVPATLLLTLLGATSLVFAAGSLVCGLWLGWLAFRFARQRSADRARRLFLGSVIYLPILLGLMAIDRTPALPGAPPTPAHHAAALFVTAP